MQTNRRKIKQDMIMRYRNIVACFYLPNYFVNFYAVVSEHLEEHGVSVFRKTLQQLTLTVKNFNFIIE